MTPNSNTRFRPSVTESMAFFAGCFFTFCYAWIMDDAYIYYRYVDNLVLHHWGLVYTPGEYVEGFSSPLWVLVLIPIRLLRVDYWLFVRAFGLVAFGMFWWLAVKINRRMAGQDSVIVNAPLLLITFTYGAMCYFTSGLETPLIILCATLYAGFYMYPEQRLLAVCLALSPLLRYEFHLTYGVAFLWLWASTRKFPVAMFLPYAISTFALQVFRVWYYADLLPNTFYLKDEFWFAQGFLYLYDTVIAYNYVFIFGVLALMYALVRKRVPLDRLFESRRLMMVVTALAVLVYVLKIGGDSRHFRYLLFPYCLFVFAFAGIPELAVQPFHRKHKNVIVLVTVLFALLLASGYPRQLQHHPIFRGRFHEEYRMFLKINDATKYRMNLSVPRIREVGISPPLLAFGRTNLSYSSAMHHFTTQPEAIIAEGNCAVAYRQARAKIVHAWGLTEPFLVRLPIGSDLAGHKLLFLDLSDELVELRKRYGFRRGAFADAISDGTAPQWVVENFDILQFVEDKVYNRHKLPENIGLTLRGLCYTLF